ncbi:phage holin family protein [Actinoallomurus purpureus]|uniref:phage holin family protein n=1 Tax=Actinoallomurus purpureus TaxID=478114 RepID=UPI00209271A2|nr:phage holin family protein [Actinoallomurus purpureus]MCO6005559.1 phage holin family protein [Actinoallomurus purpureus]
MSTFVHGPGTRRTTTSGDTSIGRLVSDATADLQKLMRQEVALAKAEIHEEATKAGKAAGLFGGAGFAGYMVLVLLSFAAVIGIGHVLDLGWAALIVAGLWAIAGAVMYTLGRRRMRTVSPTPHRTVETLKEDAQLMRHPTGARAIAAEPVSAELPAGDGDGRR